MNLHFILLDVAQGIVMLTPFFIVHILLTIFIEAWVLSKFHSLTFKKSALYSFEMNLVSLIAGLLLFQFFKDLAGEMDFDYRAVLLVGLFFILSLIVEFLVIRLVCKSYPIKSLLKALIIGNILTYALFILILFILN